RLARLGCGRARDAPPQHARGRVRRLRGNDRAVPVRRRPARPLPDRRATDADAVVIGGALGEPRVPGGRRAGRDLCRLLRRAQPLDERARVLLDVPRPGGGGRDRSRPGEPAGRVDDGRARRGHPRRRGRHRRVIRVPRMSAPYRLRNGGRYRRDSRRCTGHDSSVNRVLLVEDDPTIREMTRMTLERDGFVVETAGDGQAGLDAFDRGIPDVVLLDVMLPGIDGVTVCRRIRSQSVVPIVMLSARTDPIDIVLGLEAGADDYVTKPFEPPILSARLRAVLRRATRLAEGSRMR